MVIIGFMLAVLAHVKLFITNRAIISVFDTLVAQISRVSGSEVETDAPKLVVAPEVLPNPPHFVDAVVLQTFYALNDVLRTRVFHDVASVANLQPAALSNLYEACYGHQNVQRSMSFQTLLRRIDATQYGLVKQAIDNAFEDQKSVHSNGDDIVEVISVKASVVPVETVKKVSATVKKELDSVAPVPAVPAIEAATSVDQQAEPALLVEPTIGSVGLEIVEAKKKRTSKSRAKAVESAPLDASL